MNFNQIILIGRLGRDPELTYSQAGSARCRLSLATTKQLKDTGDGKQSRTVWHNVVCWNKAAENAAKYLKKGDIVQVVGEADCYKVQDTKNGGDLWIHEINAHTVIFGPNSRPEQQPPQEQQQQRQQRQQQQPPKQANSKASQSVPEDDDIPF